MCFRDFVKILIELLEELKYSYWLSYRAPVFSKVEDVCQCERHQQNAIVCVVVVPLTYHAVKPSTSRNATVV